MCARKQEPKVTTFEVWDMFMDKADGYFHILDTTDTNGYYYGDTRLRGNASRIIGVLYMVRFSFALSNL